MPVTPSAKPWGEARAVAANDNRPIGGLKRRMLTIMTALFLAGGAALHLINIPIDSVVIAHTSRSAMIFGLVGLRRSQTASAEDADDRRNADA